MISGRPVFAAASPASVIAAILAHDPPWLSATSTSVSPTLDATVQRCLAKSPDDRFQSASDLRFALQTLGHEPPHEADVGRHRRRRALPLRAVLIVAGAIALTGIGWMVTRPRSFVGASVPRLLNPLQVTHAVGVEDDAAWSPDGRTLAYAADPRGGLENSNWDIWVVQPGGTQSLNRTPESAADDRFPSWSPNGVQLAFWSSRDGGGCYVMPALAGSPRRIAEASRLDPNPPAWSADGSQIACVTLEGADVYATIHTLRDGSSRRVALPGPVGRRLDLTWSPDQKFMAYVETSSGLASDATQLWVLRLGDGKAFPITEGRYRTWSPSWSPQSDAVYFVSNLDGAMDLWRQALAADGGPVGPAARVTTGIGMRSASLSSDGSKLVYSQGRKIANVWRAPIPANGRVAWHDAQQITFDQAYIEFVNVSPDRKRLIVTSDRSGNPDLWQLSLDGGEMQHVVADPAPDWGGTWSPDGEYIAFFSYRSGNRDLWRVAVKGGPAEQLTDDPGSDLLPTWSPDGKTIAFESRRAGAVGIWLLPAAGGQPRPVPTLGPRWAPRWSPDGRWLAALSLAGELWRISPTGADPEVRLADQVGASIWSRDSRSVYFTGQGTRQNTVFAMPTDGGPERALVDLSGRRGVIGDMATDGPNLYFTWEEHLGDVWVADVVQAPPHSR
jgi:Tol biopolymer transport system component